MQRRAVVVGASLGGLRAAESLRQGGYDGVLTIIGAERHLPYDRPPLSKQILTGKAGPDDLALRLDADLDAEWQLGIEATGLDLDRRLVQVAAGDDVPYDVLVIATGAHPRTLLGAAPGPGVHYLRTLEDAIALRDDLGVASRAVVVGAGFIGLEVAASARTLGIDVTVVEALPVPLERAVGARMGAVLADLHRRHQVDVRLGVGVAGLVGTDRVEGVRLADGGVVPAEVVVVGVGVAPATAWLDRSGVDLSDGVLCDDRLRVLVDGLPRPDVVAVGDVTRWRHPGYGRSVRVEHWTNAAEQGEAAARTLLEGAGAPPFAPTPYFWSDQFGVKIQFVGETLAGDEVAVIEGDPAEDRFVAAYGREGRLVAALGVRRPARVLALQALIGAGAAFPLEG
jgi:3-phenylpropionate/trans-cinnamate dioxygenase ferredoxin reductase component